MVFLDEMVLPIEIFSNDTVDGRKPAPPGMYKTFVCDICE